MADNPFGAAVGGFFSSLIDPFSEQTQTQNADTTSTRKQGKPTKEARTTSAVATITPTRTTSTLPSSTSEGATTISATTSSSSPTTLLSLSSTTSTSLSIATTSSSSIVPMPTSAAQSVPSSSSSSSSSSSPNAGAIAGGVVGGLAVLALLAFGILWLLRRDQRRTTEREKQSSSKKGPYEGSVVSLVAYHGKDTKDASSWLESRPSTQTKQTEPWDAESIKAMPSARLNSGPAIFVTDEFDQRRHICELPGSEPEMPRTELESGQKYHAYRPKPS